MMPEADPADLGVPKERIADVSVHIRINWQSRLAPRRRLPKMLKSLKEHVVLWIQTKTGLTSFVFVALGSAGLALVMAFVFLCVSAYVSLSTKIGPVFGGLALAGAFVLIAILGIAAAVLSRRRTKQRAILERAARGNGVALVDPRTLNVIAQAARTLGWRRIAPLALLGFLVAQWAQETLGPHRTGRP